jgi:hypothetical protein
MNTGMGTRLKRIAKVVACLCAIEMFLPGGTLIVLGYLVAARHHVHGSAEGEHAVTAWSEFRRLFSANTGGGSNRAEDNSAGPETARRRAASEGSSVSRES